MDTLNRSDEYIGRETVKEKLLESLLEIAKPDATCHVLVLQGAGGLGKTHLLELLPRILQEGAAQKQATLPPFLMPAPLDAYLFETQEPFTAQRRLIEGLAQQAQEAYRLPPDEVTEAFKPHKAAYDEYLKARDRGTSQEKGARQEVNRLFIEGWNRITTQRPIILSVDTLETLFPDSRIRELFPADPDEQTVTRWLTEAAKELKRTLVLLSGRHIPIETLDEALLKPLLGQGIKAEPIEIEPLDSLKEIVTYLQSRSNASFSLEDLPIIRRITMGRPLLLNCYPLFRELAPQANLPESRTEFENWLLDTLFDPILASSTTSQNPDSPPITRIYCLYFLTIARRGLTKPQFHELFDHLQLTYDKPTVESLYKNSFIKHIGDLLLLHDEIFEMIDKSERAKKTYDIQQPILNFLLEGSRKQVGKARQQTAWAQQQQQTRELGLWVEAMSNFVYYTVMNDVPTGYFQYTIYANRLLDERDSPDFMVLQVALQRALKRHFDAGTLLPNAEPSPYIREREEVLLIKRLAMRDDLSSLAIRQAEELAQRYETEQRFQHRHREASVAALYTEFILQYAYVKGWSGEPQDVKQVETRYEELITFLHTPPLEDERFTLSVPTYLGEAHNQLGYLYRRQLRLEEAIREYEQAILDYKNYSPEVRERFADNISTYLVQTRINLAYALASEGRLHDAMNQSEKVLGEIGQPDALISPYRLALFYNVEGQILIRAGEADKAHASMKRAEEWAEAANSRRARTLVKIGRILVDRKTMRAREEPDEDIRKLADEAEEIVNAHDHLSGLRVDVLLEKARYLRDMGIVLAAQKRPDEAQAYWEESNQTLESARSPAAGQPRLNILPTAQVDILENMAVNYLHLKDADGTTRVLTEAGYILAETDFQSSPRRHLLAGKVAFQLSLLYILRAGTITQDSLQHMLWALARTNLFAPDHSDSKMIHTLIRREIMDIQTAEEALMVQKILAHKSMSKPPTRFSYQEPTAQERKSKWSQAWRMAYQSLDEWIKVRLD